MELMVLRKKELYYCVGLFCYYVSIYLFFLCLNGCWGVMRLIVMFVIVVMIFLIMWGIGICGVWVLINRGWWCILFFVFLFVMGCSGVLVIMWIIMVGVVVVLFVGNYNFFFFGFGKGYVLYSVSFGYGYWESDGISIWRNCIEFFWERFRCGRWLLCCFGDCVRNFYWW